MSYEELDNQFDVLFNNITSNQAPGLNTYEKCVFLTKAQNEIVKNYFTANSKGNNIGQGFDDSAKRQADFSCLMKTANCTEVSSSFYANCEKSDGTASNRISVDSLSFTHALDPSIVINVSDFKVNHRYEVFLSGPNVIVSCAKGPVKISGFPYTSTSVGGLLGYLTFNNASDVDGKIDPRSILFTFPSDVFIVINETLRTVSNRLLQVIPLKYDRYTLLMSKPFKRPVKNQAWRLINFGVTENTFTKRYVEIIAGPKDVLIDYYIRYIRFPKPIIVGDLDGLTVDGYEFGEPTEDNDKLTQGCELDPILHEDILQRAVELAKIAWTNNGQDNMQPMLQAGTRSE